jgi:hypothetical protein
MRRSLIPGLILVLLGCTCLLINLGYLGWGVFFRLFSLWPLILVVIGIELIARSGNFLFLRFLPPLLILGAFVWVVTGKMYTEEPLEYAKTTYVSQILEEGVSEGKVSLDYGAGKLFISGGTDYLLEGNLEYYGQKPVVKSAVKSLEDSSSIQKVKVRMKQIQLSRRRRLRPRHHWSNTWEIHLTDEVPLEMSIDAGACELDLDMSALKVKSLDLDVGATSATIRFGDLVADVEAEIDAGASALKIDLPMNVGAKIRLSSALSAHNLGDIGFEKEGKKTYCSPGYENASKKIRLDISLGAGSLDFNLY